MVVVEHEDLLAVGQTAGEEVVRSQHLDALSDRQRPGVEPGDAVRAPRRTTCDQNVSNPNSTMRLRGS